MNRYRTNSCVKESYEFSHHIVKKLGSTKQPEALLQKRKYKIMTEQNPIFSSNETSGELNIHSENILPIIKKWLYSEHDIFLRELASNALDAITKRKILESKKEVPVSDHSLDRIDIVLDREKNSLTVSDTGIGMNQDECVRFLSQIAFSGAEEFMKTYQMKDGFIGHFGLGFFSSFMVANHVDVRTRSAKEETTILWSSDGSTKYTVGVAANPREHQGTDVVLFLNEESRDFLDEAHVKECLDRYCRFFPVPIFLNGKQIGNENPVWTKSPQETVESEYLTLYRTLYPLQPDPLFWVHIHVDYPFHVQGVLYFPSKIGREYDGKQTGVSLFCNRVFVSDNCKDILPEYLSMMQGVIDSPDIPLNVSRSHLQVDKTVKTLSTHIAKKVSDALTSLLKSDRKKYEKVWPSCEVVVKLGMLQDDKFFDRLYDALLFKTINKEQNTDEVYKTLVELANSQESSKNDEALQHVDIIYCDPGQEKSPLLAELEKKNKNVLSTSSLLDHPLMAQLERKTAPATSQIPSTTRFRFHRIDSQNIIDTILDKKREKTILDSDGKTEETKIADFFRSALKGSHDSMEVSAKSLAIDSLPAIVTLDENERRTRDYSARFMRGEGQDFLKHFKPKAHLVVNTNSDTVKSIVKASERDPEMAHEMAEYMVSLARLTHNELSQGELEQFIKQSSRFLGHVASKIETKA